MHDDGVPIDCVDEPIRTPEGIQPHGYLLVVDGPDMIVGRVSSNIDELTGMGASSVLGAPLAGCLPDSIVEAVRQHRKALFEGTPEMAFGGILTAQDEPRSCDVHLFPSAGERVVVEIENVRAIDATTLIESRGVLLVQEIMSRMDKPATLLTLAEAIVTEVRRLTGFDRVMLYRFHDDDHGEVYSESVIDGWGSYLGLHYPESDIPAQARALYCVNRTRSITTVDYEPIPLLRSAEAPAAPLDMTFSQLRAVSPVHLEYLRNMGVASSMSISLMDGDRLWGLVACHHRVPHRVDHRARIVCELLGTLFSLMLMQLEEAEQARAYNKLTEIERQLLSQMASSRPFVDGAFRNLPNLSNLTDADGAASIAGSTVGSIGSTPSDEQIVAFVDWLDEHVDEDVFASDRIADRYPPAAGWDHGLCGVLVIEIARARRQYLLCFRGERVQRIDWAGNPDKAVGPRRSDGRLAPRASFAKWTETVRGTSRAWQPIELKVAGTLRRATLYLIVDWAEEVARLNQKLAQSNDNLEAFAMVAAHDLKEPFRGIHNYASFLMEDHAAVLDMEMRRKITSISELADRGNTLTDSLLEFASLGQGPTRHRPIALDTLVDQALAVLATEIERLGVTIVRTKPLPVVSCDPLQVSQVFQNLIANAIKYTDRERPRVEIGSRDHVAAIGDWLGTEHLDDRTVLVHVRDNGIGIAEDQLDEVFRLFRRLHPRTLYGGGNGIGLAIARRIVELHGGRIWAESEPGEGSTFYFTIGA